MIRAFIAVELPGALKEEVSALQAKMQEARADVKWVESENLHLTLKFLGEVPEEKIPLLIQEFEHWPRVMPRRFDPAARSSADPSRLVEERVEDCLSTAGKSSAAAGPVARPFTITLEGIGAFPRTTSPRIIWVGIGEGKESLINLARWVEECCSRLGFPSEERPFSAHLTIGRVHSKDRLAGLIKELQVVEFKAATPAPVNHLTLFQSTLSSKGPTYTPLAKIPLG